MTRTGRPAASAGDRARPLEVFVIAGEASGDALGGALMNALEEAAPGPVRYRGIGGPSMQEAGLSSLFDFSELSVMGLVEILPHAGRLLRRVRETAAAIERDPPDILITIDSPGFVFAVVKRLRGHQFPRIAGGKRYAECESDRG